MQRVNKLLWLVMRTRQR